VEGGGVLVPLDQDLRQPQGRLGPDLVLVERAAAAAGLLPTRFDRYGNIVLGDVIVSIDGRKVDSTNAFYDLLEGYQVGDRVRVGVLRGNQEKTLTIKLEDV